MHTVKFTNFISRWQAEHTHQLHKPIKKAVLISITDPDRPEADLYHKAWEGILRLKFHDMDHQPRAPQSKSDIIFIPQNYILFNEDNAKEIMNFLAKHEGKVDTVVAHCEAGISRSAAVAKYVAYAYGLPFPENYMLYNKLVFSTLVATHQRAMHAEDGLDHEIPGIE